MTHSSLKALGALAALAALHTTLAAQETPEARTEAPQDANPDAALIERGKEIVMEAARDPSSVQFKDEHVSRLTIDEEAAKRTYLKPGTEVVAMCSRVNAKNAFGGYTGWQETVAFIEGRDYAPVQQVAPNGVSGLAEVATLCPGLFPNRQ